MKIKYNAKAKYAIIYLAETFFAVTVVVGLFGTVYSFPYISTILWILAASALAIVAAKLIYYPKWIDRKEEKFYKLKNREYLNYLMFFGLVVLWFRLLITLITGMATSDSDLSPAIVLLSFLILSGLLAKVSFRFPEGHLLRLKA